MVNVSVAAIECFWSQPLLAKVLEQYLVIVKAGDFNRNHIGPTLVPEDLAENIIRMPVADVKRAVNTNQILLATVLQTYPRGETTRCIEYLDQANAFSMGIIIYCDIHQKDPVQMLEMSWGELLQVELDFVDTVERLARDHGLTGKIANEELRRSKRSRTIKLWPRWIDDLLINPLQPS